jgi:hypothetical protein
MSRRSACSDYFSGIFNFSPEASAEVGGGVFTDSKRASKTLAILLFLGVVVVAADSFGNNVIIIFGCSATFSDSGSLVGSAIASIGITRAVTVAREQFLPFQLTSAHQSSQWVSVYVSKPLLSSPSMHQKMLKQRISFFSLAFGREISNLDKQTQ